MSTMTRRVHSDHFSLLIIFSEQKKLIVTKSVHNNMSSFFFQIFFRQLVFHNKMSTMTGRVHNDHFTLLTIFPKQKKLIMTGSAHNNVRSFLKE